VKEELLDNFTHTHLENVYGYDSSTFQDSQY